MNNNRGLLKEPQVNPKDYRFGMVTGITYEVLNESGDWSDYLPTYEPQSNSYFDTMSCVTFAGLNCIEMLYKKKIGVEANFSDRFSSFMSGTTQQGNYMSSVGESFRLDGVIDESDYPFNDVRTWDEYHTKPDDTLILKGKEWAKNNTIGWEWCGTDKNTLKKVLTLSPVSITFQVGSPKNSSGYYINRPDTDRDGHVISLYNITDEYYETYDHYDNKFKKLDISYRINNAMRWSLTLNTMVNNPANLVNDTLVQLVEGIGGFGLYLNGNIIIDDLDKVQASWLVRNNGNITNKTKALTQAQWDSYRKTNLKGEQL